MLKIRVQKQDAMVSVPHAFVDEYMPRANALYAVVYLFFLRHCGEADMTCGRAADALDVLESDVVKGLRYWEQAGLLRLENGTDKTVLGVEFLPFPYIAVVPKMALIPAKAAEPAPPEDDRDSRLREKPQYTVEELEIYNKKSAEIRDYFAMAESMLGRMLKYDDLNTLFALYDWLRLPIEVVEILLVHCANNGHRNMRYIEKTAVDWADNGVDTPEKAEEYMLRHNGEYREIMKAFGLKNEPTPAQTKFMRTWLDRLPLDVVLEACDRTILSIGKPKFSYTETILANWHANGIQDLDGARAADEAFHKDKEEKTENAPKRQALKRNRFIDIKQREWDFEQIEAMAQRNLEQSVAGEGT